ncbi:hypothetical protein M9Y10_044540 [Tritrichomonas musculus]|uniref:Uncharacterized protein n=1 Tax=Tritrichomonas musculus TaxID=1915356 RepID=A0ABR2JSP8_9EUKA
MIKCNSRKKKIFSILITILLFAFVLSLIFVGIFNPSSIENTKKRYNHHVQKLKAPKQLSNSLNTTSKIKEYDIEPLTIICLPYPVMTNRLRDRYLISMSSWLLTSNTTKIMILMPPYEFDPNLILLPLLESLFGKNRILFGPSLETDEDGVPYIDEWFIKGLDSVTASSSSSSELLCWINADIITPNGWLQRVSYLYDYFIKKRNRQISVISRRCDFDISDDATTEFFNEVDTYAKTKSNNIWPPDFDKIAGNRKLHSTWGIDFFLVSKEPKQINFDEIPPFHLGKYRWDPWITGWLRKNMPLITLGDDFCTYHLNHVPKGREMDDIKVKENFEEARRRGNYKVPNGLASFYLRGRYLYEKGKDEPLDKIYESIPLANAPDEKEN